jgi:chromosome segregation ATPase
MPGHSIPPDAPNQWRPRTRATALAALEESRRYAARLEASARQQQAREEELRAELATLRAGAVTGRDELINTKERLTRAEQQKNEKVKESYRRKRQAERLVDRLKQTEREVARKEKVLEQARADLAALRRAHEQQTVEQASNLSDARAEVKELSKTRDELATKVKKLAETTEQLEQRAADVAQELKQRDYELDHERKQTDEAKRGRDEAQAHTELLQRRLEAEQAKRTAAEQKLEESAQAGSPQRQMTAPATRSSLGMSSLRLGCYQELTAVLGYDPTSDRLFELMHEELQVAAAYADWQATHMERITARRRDFDQSPDEQAFAAVMSARWHLVDHPHVRLASRPRWRPGGCLLDEKSETYVMAINRERISEMKRRLATGA